MRARYADAQVADVPAKSRPPPRFTASTAPHEQRLAVLPHEPTDFLPISTPPPRSSGEARRSCSRRCFHHCWLARRAAAASESSSCTSLSAAPKSVARPAAASSAVPRLRVAAVVWSRSHFTACRGGNFHQGAGPTFRLDLRYCPRSHHVFNRSPRLAGRAFGSSAACAGVFSCTAAAPRIGAAFLEDVGFCWYLRASFLPCGLAPKFELRPGPRPRVSARCGAARVGGAKGRSSVATLRPCAPLPGAPLSALTPGRSAASRCWHGFTRRRARRPRVHLRKRRPQHGADDQRAERVQGCGRPCVCGQAALERGASGRILQQRPQPPSRCLSAVPKLAVDLASASSPREGRRPRSRRGHHPRASPRSALTARCERDHGGGPVPAARVLRSASDSRPAAAVVEIRMRASSHRARDRRPASAARQLARFLDMFVALREALDEPSARKLGAATIPRSCAGPCPARCSRVPAAEQEVVLQHHADVPARCAGRSRAHRRRRADKPSLPVTPASGG